MTTETLETLESVEDFTDKLLANKRAKITQDMMIDFTKRQRDVSTLRSNLKSAENILDAYTEAYTAMLQSNNVRQESGELALTLDVSSRQALVKWKEKFAQVAGPKAVEDAQAEAGKTTITKVVVVSTNPAK